MSVTVASVALPSPTVVAATARRINLKTDFARLTSGSFAAIQIDAGGRRLFVVATSAETEQGWIVDDGRTRFEGLHAAFDAAHRLAARQRRAARYDLDRAA